MIHQKPGSTSPPAPAKDDTLFDMLVMRCESLNTLLEEPPGGLSGQQKVNLASACRTHQLAPRPEVLLFEE